MKKCVSIQAPPSFALAVIQPSGGGGGGGGMGGPAATIRSREDRAMRHLIGDRNRANERECGSSQSMDGHAIARFEHKCNLRREVRRGFDFRSVFQYHAVNIAS